MAHRILVLFGGLAFACTALAPGALAQGGGDIPRTPSGRPDLSGTYDIATLTPLQRARQFGDRQTLTAEEASIAASDPVGFVELFDLGPAGSDERAAARGDAVVSAEAREAPRPSGATGPVARRGTSAATTPSGSTAGTPHSKSTGRIARRSSLIRQTGDSRRGHPRTGPPRRRGGGPSGRTAGPPGGSRTTSTRRGRMTTPSSGRPPSGV